MDLRKFYDRIAKGIQEDMKKKLYTKEEIIIYHNQFKRLFHFFIDLYSHNAIILDVGCGRGGDII